MKKSTITKDATVIIKDPYEDGPIIIANIEKYAPLSDWAEIIEVLDEDTRLTDNLERKERYHRECSLDSLEYEGLLFGTGRSAEDEYFANEEILRVAEIKGRLTETQLRRFEAYEQGASFHQIAEDEGFSVMSVKESIDSARKKIKKYL